MSIEDITCIDHRAFQIIDTDGQVWFEIGLDGKINIAGGISISSAPDALMELLSSDGYVNWRIGENGVQQPLAESLVSEAQTVGRAVRIWTGALTHDGFRIAFDVEGGSMQSTAEIELATDEQFNIIERRSPVIMPTATEKDSDHFWRSVVSEPHVGLEPDTQYFGRVIVDGRAGDTFKVRTAPAPHVGADFSFLLWTCNELSDDPSEVVNSHRAMSLEDDVLFNIQAGDIAYANLNQAEMPPWRARVTRAYRSNTDVSALLLRQPTVYAYGDHDSGPNDNTLESVVPAPATIDDVYKACRRQYVETVPAYPFVQAVAGETNPDKVLPIQVFDIAKARFIVLDVQTQARKTGGATVLGDGTVPAGSFDQLNWLLDEALVEAGEAVDEGDINNIFLVTARGWSASSSLAWGDEDWDHERQAICDRIDEVIDHQSCAVTILTGDMHWSGYGWGAETDFSTGLVLRSGLRQIQSSPAKRDAGDGDPLYWNGSAVQFVDAEQFARIDVKADGGWVAHFKGSDYDPVTFEPEPKGSADTAAIVDPCGAALAAYLAAMTVQPSASEARQYRRLIASLMSYGIWGKLDAVYVLAAHDEQAARVNLKAPGTYTATGTGTPSPAFTAFRGFQFNGATNYLDTGFKPQTAGGQLSQDSASMFVWSLSHNQHAGADIGTLKTRLGMRSATGTGNFTWRPNTAASEILGSSDSRGMGAWSRRALGVVAEAYRDGASVDVASTSSETLDNTNILIGAATGASTSFGGRQLAAAGWGAGLTSGEQAELYKAFNRYLVAVGAA